jgi:hypothetical protein
VLPFPPGGHPGERPPELDIARVALESHSE